MGVDSVPVYTRIKMKFFSGQEYEKLDGLYVTVDESAGRIHVNEYVVVITKNGKYYHIKDEPSTFRHSYKSGISQQPYDPFTIYLNYDFFPFLEEISFDQAAEEAYECLLKCINKEKSVVENVTDFFSFSVKYNLKAKHFFDDMERKRAPFEKKKKGLFK